MALGGGFALMGGLPELTASPGNQLDLLDPSGRSLNLLAPPAKLNANENPFGPSDRVRRALQEGMGAGCRYPFAYLKPLVKAIAEKEEVPENCVVITGGSTEGLKAAGLVYGIGGGEIVAADPTFQALLRYAEHFGAYVHRVPLDETHTHDLDAMERRIHSKTRLIFLCNPNNPTGTLLEKDRLKDFCVSTQNKAVVFSDEAYYDFITEPDYPSMVSLVREGLNVIVSKTFSKVYGLAGMRIGYLIARPDMALRLREALMANTNTLAILAAREALADTAFYKFSLQQNELAKAHLYAELEKMGISYIPSHTNFVFFKSGMEIRELIEAMNQKGVQIGRPFPPLTHWARISTGTMEDMHAFTGALKTVLS